MSCHEPLVRGFGRTHIRPLQPETVFSTCRGKGGEGGKGGDLTATNRQAVRSSASAC
jgi:hypothetical protein